MIVIGRPINGISINGLEYVLDESGNAMTFETAYQAIEFLCAHGIGEDEMETIIFEEVKDDMD